MGTLQVVQSAHRERAVRQASSVLHRDQHPAAVPFYTCEDASRYLHLALPTILSFRQDSAASVAVGEHPPREGWATCASSEEAISFRQLVELHVLSVLPRWTGLTESHALIADPRFRDVADRLAGADLRTEACDRLVAGYLRSFRLDAEWQPQLCRLLESYLARVDWDEDGLPIRLYPFTRDDPVNSPKQIALDPRVRFGRPALVRRGLPTEVIVDRFRGGETVAELADDYALSSEEVEEALRYEGRHG